MPEQGNNLCAVRPETNSITGSRGDKRQRRSPTAGANNCNPPSAECGVRIADFRVVSVYDLLLRKDAGCWMLDARVLSSIQHPASSIFSYSKLILSPGH